MPAEGRQGKHWIRAYYNAQGPVFSCAPCQIFQAVYPNDRIRNRAIERHLAGRSHRLKKR